MHNMIFLEFSIGAVGMAALVVGIVGLLVGVLLGIAAKAFAVKVDEREGSVRELLPGNNCGGCGFAGCDALAKAIAAGEAAINACPVAGAAVHAQIGAIMGQSAEAAEKKVAFVKCHGTCDKTTMKYRYDGIADCKKAAVLPGRGEKLCSYGCMGYGSCVAACKFDAIHIVNGVALVDEEKCVACGACVKECPNGLIELVPAASVQRVACSSRDKGKQVKDACQTGCIGCMLCVKACEFGAVAVENNLAHIDYSKCTHCGKCAQKCPQKIILPGAQQG